jgi:uracil phosphoribosyltransferase
MPDVCVGYLGLERDETTAQARSYYCKLPILVGKRVVIVDPMLATGGSAKKAVEQVKAAGGKNITMVSVVAAPEGVQVLESAFPDVDIYTAGLDSHLDEHKYIVPGLGDFGDRLFGT